MSNRGLFNFGGSNQLPSHSNSARKSFFGVSRSRPVNQTSNLPSTSSNRTQSSDRSWFGKNDDSKFVPSSSQSNSQPSSIRSSVPPTRQFSREAFLQLLSTIRYFQQTPQSISGATSPTASSQAPITEYYHQQQLIEEEEAKLKERQKNRFDVFDRVGSMMEMDVDGSDDHRELIAARKFALTPEERNKVQQVLRGPPDGTVVIDKFNVEMSRKNIACLRDGAWLNDEVINFYMSMLQERDDRLCQEQPGRKSSHFFNSFFLSKLLERDSYTFSNVRRWTKKFDILSKDKIFFPVNIRNTHWTLAVVYVQKKQIVYYDSMSGSGRDYLQALKKWFADDVKDKKNQVMDMSEWELISQLPDVPQQHNGYDCGVFTITFADFLSDNLPLQFSQQDITENRQRFTSSILKGSLPY